MGGVPAQRPPPPRAPRARAPRGAAPAVARLVRSARVHCQLAVDRVRARVLLGVHRGSHTHRLDRSGVYSYFVLYIMWPMRARRSIHKFLRKAQLQLQT